MLRAELDAYYAALYGLTRDELRYILDPQDVCGPEFPGETFRLVKDREMKLHGEYRTQRLVLEAWDRLGLRPRKRDGRYDAGAPTKTEAPPLNGTTSAPTVMGLGVVDSENSRTSASSVSPQAPPPPLVLRQQMAPNRTTALQPTLPGLRSNETSLRSRALDLALQLIATSAPIKAKDIAQRLREVDARIDRSLVNSVLYHEGAARVDYDEATSLYRPKNAH